MSTSDKLAQTVGANAPMVQKTAGAVAKSDKPKTLIDLLRLPGTQKQLALALPKSLTSERLTRIVMTEIRKNPSLMNCEQKSFLGAVMQSAQLGLEPGNALGHCYLIPFNNRAKGVTEAQLILGYRGMIDLARRSGQIVSINAYIVKACDDFKYCLGLHPDITHIPSPDADRSSYPTTYVYAVANLKGGGVQFLVMSRAEIEAVRNNAANYQFARDKKTTIWAKFFDDMAMKTCIRRMFKYLPVSIEAMQLVDIDERRDRGETITTEDLKDDLDVNTFNMDASQVEEGEIVEPAEKETETPPAAAAPAPENVPEKPAPRKRGAPRKVVTAAPVEPAPEKEKTEGVIPSELPF